MTRNIKMHKDSGGIEVKLRVMSKIEQLKLQTLKQASLAEQSHDIFEFVNQLYVRSINYPITSRTHFQRQS